MSILTAAIGDAYGLIGDLASPYALITQSARAIGTIIADVTVSEVHQDELIITDHPVESGAVISDHAFKRPASVEIRPCFSDSSAGYVGYVRQIYQQLLALQESRGPFDVYTGKRLYRNMLMPNLSVSTEDGSEFALIAVVRCREIKITSVKTSGSDNSGNTQATQANPADTSPESKVGSNPLSLTSFGTSGPNASVGTSVGSEGLVGGGGPVSFDSYMSGFSTEGTAIGHSTVSTPGGGIGRA